jgi:hypothetical protein
LKGIVAERLLNAEVNDVFKSEFKNIVDFMMTDSKIPSEDILFDIKRMDDRKGGKFSDSHSEVAVLLGLS